MSRAMRLFLLAVLAAPAIAYVVYRLAKGLGFLDPPQTKEQEYRRTIVLALYAFLLFLPIFLYGYEKNWPRVWVVFGVVNGMALLVFAAAGIASAIRLWKLRHPTFPLTEPEAESTREEPLDIAGRGSGISR